MASTTEIREKQDAILAELADLGLSLARDLHARALAASGDASAGEMALAFHRISRSTRQTLALQSRLERDRKLADREDRQDQARETLARVQARRREVRDAVAPLLWTEYEPDEAEALCETLEALVWNESEDQHAFLAEPLKACIARIREALGLPADDPEAEDETTEIPRQSSG